MFKCKYCNTTYLKSFTLKTHQKKSKKCLKNQENYNNIVNNSIELHFKIHIFIIP